MDAKDKEQKALYQITVDIFRSKKTLKKQPEFSKTLKEQLMQTLEHESLTHSDKIEHPSKSECGPDIEEIHRKRIKNLKSAAEFGTDYLDQTNGTIDKPFFCEIVKRIEPERYQEGADYRKKPIFVDGSQVTRPNFETVPKAMSELIERFNNKNKNIIERVTNLHLYLLYIHPFDDGNGRTARMAYNLILKKNKLPATIITKSEKPFYFQLVEEALKEIREEESIKEKTKTERRDLFYSYLATKTNESLDRMITTLCKKRRYEISNLSFQNLYNIEDLKKKCQTYFRKSEKEGEVHITHKHTRIHIVGDISKQEIETILLSYSGLENHQLKNIY